MRMKYLFAIILLLLVSCNTEDSIEKQISDYVSQMTLDEKIAVIHAQSKFSSPGVPRLGIPELWTMDGPHGVRPEVLWDEWTSALWTSDSCTAYPVLTCLAASWDKEMAALYGQSVGEEARYRKKNVLLGPGLNICRTPLCGRNFEYMGEDPYLAGKMSVPYIKGIQNNKVAACVKHYALNNQEFKRHRVNVNIDERTLHEIYLPAFKMAVQEGGVWSVMSSYNLFQGVWVSHNKYLLTDILKKDWGFDGAVISDWGAVHETVGAARAGMDLEFGTKTDGVSVNVSNAYDQYYLASPYKKMIQNGELPIEDLDDKVRRVLRLNLRTQLGGNWGKMCTPEHFADSRKIASAGIVLLKNDNNILPMRTNAGKIVVLGENAIRPMVVGGNSSSLKTKYEILPLEGIRNAFPDADVVYERAYVGEPKLTGNYNYGLYDLSDARTPEELLKDALSALKNADYVIFIGGLNKNKFQDCEAGDRSSYELPYGQNEVISAIAEARPDMIYVNMSGSPVAMPFADKVGAVVQGWYLGSETGNALADVLTGKVNPSGKLPFTFPYQLSDGPIKTQEQYPGIEGENDMWQVYYDEGIYVGYRWYDAHNIEPQFPFGYGLSYTTFKYGQARASSKQMGKKLTVRVPVTNIGDVAGAEVVQLYIHDVTSSVDRPVKELKGFEKVYLEPGETAEIEFVITRDDLSFYDSENHQWVAEEGEFEAIIAASSRDIRSRIKFNLL